MAEDYIPRDPMEMFHDWCLADDRYRILMQDDAECPGYLIYEAVAQYRADYMGEIQTLTLEGLEI